MLEAILLPGSEDSSDCPFYDERKKGEMAMRLFEQHLVVSDLNRSAQFYEQVLGCTLGLDTKEVRFYWVDADRRSMLGLWQQGGSHNAFAPDTGKMIRDQLPEKVRQLKEVGVEVVDFFGQPTEEGSVHPWVPVVSVYFFDPDGHALEFLSLLPDSPRPGQPVMSWRKWRSVTEEG